MKKIYGNKDTFALEYEKTDKEDNFFETWIDKKPVCSFKKNGEIQVLKCNLKSLAEWFENNIEYIVTEDNFPLPIKAKTSIDFYNKSSEFDSDNIDEFDKWYGVRQEWYFRHSWFINREGDYLPEVFFRVVEDKVEIEWDNTHTYDGIQYRFHKGIFYVDKHEFCATIHDFLRDAK